MRKLKIKVTVERRRRKMDRAERSDRILIGKCKLAHGSLTDRSFDIPYMIKCDGDSKVLTGFTYK